MKNERDAKKTPASEQEKSPRPGESELPAHVEATGSTDELGGMEVIEAEVGGEGPVDVVATRERTEEEERREEHIARAEAARAAAERADEGKRAS